jgi:hypothetical protein
MNVLFRFTQSFFDVWLNPEEVGSFWHDFAITIKNDDVLMGEVVEKNNIMFKTNLNRPDNVGHISPKHYVLLTPEEIVRWRLNNESTI